MEQHANLLRLSVAALQRWGPVGARTFRSTSLGPVDGDTSGLAWQVELAGATGSGVPELVRAVVHRVTREPAQLTCRAASAVSAVTYEVAELRPVGAPSDGAG